MTATQAANARAEALADAATKAAYFEEYEGVTGVQNFLNATQNYPELKAQQTNVYKCFLPQSFRYSGERGVAALIHPESVYTDPHGGTLREKMFERLKTKFAFLNEKMLFPEVAHRKTFILNVYGPPCGNRISFESIDNLFDVSTIALCRDGNVTGLVPGLKDGRDDWNLKGHPDRLLRMEERELRIFSDLYDGGGDWRRARLPSIHAKPLLETLKLFAARKRRFGDLHDEIFLTNMWDETKAQKDGFIKRDVRFPKTAFDSILSGPHFGVANPLYKCSRVNAVNNSDYDVIDLTAAPADYLRRVNFSPAGDMDAYLNHVPTTPWGEKYHQTYHVVTRNMLNLGGERTLIAAIVPPESTHIHTIFGLAFKEHAALQAGLLASIICDFYVKTTGMRHLSFNELANIPTIENAFIKDAVSRRSLLLNCLTSHYAALWEKTLTSMRRPASDGWAKADPRLRPERFSALSQQWSWDAPLRTDYARRQALVEIDVLTAMELEMTLEQLKTIYRLQFHVLQITEADTWYDRAGRIVFTVNKSLPGVGFTRQEWDKIKNSAFGVFTRVVTDDTLPGGPVERTIEYFAPFDRCDRERDYETAWAWFNRKRAEAEREETER
jgi:hypothetical protein